MSTVPGHDQDSRTGPTNLRIGDPTGRGRLVRFTFNGRTIDAYEGETIAAALIAAGHPSWHTIAGEPRGLFCNMGICFDCLVQVDGRPNIRACRCPVADAMKVETQSDNGNPETGK